MNRSTVVRGRAALILILCHAFSKSFDDVFSQLMDDGISRVLWVDWKRRLPECAAVKKEAEKRRTGKSGTHRTKLTKLLEYKQQVDMSSSMKASVNAALHWIGFRVTLNRL